MNKTMIAGLMGLVALTAVAADPEAGKGLTAEQQQQRSALIRQYDANQDGVLDKKEAKRMSKADKKALAKVGGIGTAKKSAEGEKAKGEAKAVKEKAEKAEKAEKVDKAEKVEKSVDEGKKGGKGKK